MDPGDDIIDVLYRYRAQQYYEAQTSIRSGSDFLSDRDGFPGAQKEKPKDPRSMFPREDSFDSSSIGTSITATPPSSNPPRSSPSTSWDKERQSPALSRSIQKDTIRKDDHDDPHEIKRRLQMDLVQLPNGVRLRTDRLRKQSESHYSSRRHQEEHVDRSSYYGQQGDLRSECSDIYGLIGEGCCSGFESDHYCSITTLKNQEDTIYYQSKESQTDPEEEQKNEKDTSDVVSNLSYSENSNMFTNVNVALGVAVMSVLAYKWAWYLAELHETSLWFTNIKEVEREISFRTEQGLYYSYYKQLVQAPSLYQGIQDLKRDNMTEHLKTINIFYRFNIHQELVMAFLYRTFGSWTNLPPIFFYSYTVFLLQGFFLCSIFAIAWIFSGTWMSGVLSVAFLVCHRAYITRVEFTICLREHWSLPFIFAQFVLVGQYLASRKESREPLFLVSIYISTVIFMITWQFSQYVLLLQSLPLFVLAIGRLIDKEKVCKIMVVFVGVILTCWYLQFYQPMVLNCLAFSLIPVALYLLWNDSDCRAPGFLNNIIILIRKVSILLTTTIAINFVFKFIWGQEADNHIFKFVQRKLGYDDNTDFETQLYLCLPIFQPIGWSFVYKLNESGVMALYLISLVFEVGCICLTVFKIWCGGEAGDQRTTKKSDRSDILQWIESHSNLKFMVQMDTRPEVVYHVAQSIVLAVLAISTSRMKCFWGPYICALAGAGVAHFGLWNCITGLFTDKSNGNRSSPNRLLVNFIRHIVLIFVVLTLYVAYKEPIYKELGDLGEFYDPDTVDLMEWIKSEVPLDAAISGSMQLMAGVKLCTGRPITNHPHFEDQDLRTRTNELYQMYAKNPPEMVHEILMKYNASYIVLEDSICMIKRDRCGLPGIMDLSNGHIPDDGIKEPEHLVPSPSKRFCDEIRHMKPPFSKLFKLAFANRTFRVYQVIPKKL